MSLANFCCCCDLRRGCVVFAWLQMMYLVMNIVMIIGFSNFYTLIIHEYKQNSKQYYPAYEIAAIISFISKCISGFLFIKIVTCISLIWGVVKQCHLFYQPWLVISGIDICVSLLLIFVFFILGINLSAIFILPFFIYGVFTALNCYFWVCVYTVYKKDMKPSMLSFEMGYSHYTNPSSEL